jgi:hypothetical protein
MKKVKLSFPPERWNIQKHSPSGSCVWGDYEFFLNQDVEECDYWFVCGNLVFDTEQTVVAPENLIFDTSESADIVNYTESFLDQFAYVSSFRTDLKHPKLIKTIPVIPWFVKNNFDELSIPNSHLKTKRMSLLASDKKISINHINRLNFVKKAHKYFGNEIDIYGAGFTEHVYDKNSTLDPYMYSIILETIQVPEYFSEKLGDCLLAQTFPIYHGCSNLSKYYDPKSYQKIDMNDFDTSVKIIKKILESDNFYESNLDSLMEAKAKYLNNYSIFPAMVSILDKVELLNKNKSLQKKEVKLIKFNSKNLLKKIKNRIIIGTYDLFHKS